jgi:adenylate cyclase
MPNCGCSHRVVIGALAGLNRLDEAQAAAVDGDIPDYARAVQRQINPGRDKIFGEGYFQVLGIAGVPERS